MGYRFVAVGLLAVLSAAAGGTQALAVYESQANAQEYHGLYQEPLRAWLAARGLAFEVIGDEVVADPVRLRRYDLLLAASVYIVPDACAAGLTQYLNEGGRAIWLDSPARCGVPTFRQALGLGTATAYAPLTDVIFRRLGGPHPAALSVEELAARRSVGNSTVEAAPGATVLYEMGGATAEGAQAAFPAVILSRPGTGRALVYNWIPQAPAQDPLLADGLDFMLADIGLTDHRLLVTPGADPASVRQPEPLNALCKLYAGVGGADLALRPSVSLIAPDGTTVRTEQLGVAAWTAADAGVAAAIARATISTADLPDGGYVLRSRATGRETDETGEVRVELSGERRAALKQAEHGRRALLEPVLAGTLGDYDAEPRTPEGRVDLPRLMGQIETAHMTMYDFLIWHAATDWEDFQAFVPLARAKGVKVWVTLCPPSEQGGNLPSSEPYRLDYVKWAEEIGRLSEEYDNLVALVIDDFWSGPNQSLFTPAYIAQVTETLRRHNPKLAFLPTIYWPTMGDADWIEAYGPLIDGIVFPYCEYVAGDALAGQLAACRQWIGPDKFLLVNVYASGSGGEDAPPRTAEYMRKTLTVSREQSDGIRLYCLPKDNLLEDERYAVTAELYGKWAVQQ